MDRMVTAALTEQSSSCLIVMPFILSILSFLVALCSVHLVDHVHPVTSHAQDDQDNYGAGR
jgi:hypothetical protein